MVNNFLRSLARLLPTRCLLCGMDVPHGFVDNSTDCGICPDCLAELPLVRHPCPLCALPLPAADALACGACLSRPPPYVRCVSATLYATPADRLIAALKYRSQLPVARALTPLLIAQIGAAPSVDVILPVPLHWQRRWRRGFNQAEVIANELARSLGIEMQARWLRRHHTTPAQQTLTADARRRNLRGAFIVTGPVTQKRIALVDDVVTTASTATELTHALLKAGATSVEVWCLARTPL